MPKGSQDGSVFSREIKLHINGKPKTVIQWYARKRYKDHNGKEREKKRTADNYAHACRLKREIEDEVKEELARPRADTELKFADLVKFYEKEYLIPPVYRAGVKIAGLRSHDKLQTFIKPLVTHFANKPLRRIEYDDLRKYKSRRLETPTHRGGQRSLACVNRELQLLRRMLNIALHRKWIVENPFRCGDPLIDTANETKRMRILTQSEETRLIAECTGLRSHLLMPLLLSIDTAARHGEEFELRWCDYDFESNVITIQSWISKTGKERIVPVTNRLRAELMNAWQLSPKNMDARIIAYKRLKRSFKTACSLAGINNYRWHDNRHTGTMRILEVVRDTARAMKITGHERIETFLRYTNINKEIAQEIGALLSARHDQHLARESVS